MNSLQDYILAIAEALEMDEMMGKHEGLALCERRQHLVAHTLARGDIAPRRAARIVVLAEDLDIINEAYKFNAEELIDAGFIAA